MFIKLIQVFLLGLSLSYKSLYAQETQTQSDSEAFLENLNEYDSFAQRQRFKTNGDDLFKATDRFFWRLFIPKLNLSFQYQDSNRTQIELQSQINLATHQAISWSIRLEWNLAFIFDDLWQFQIDSFNQNINDLALYDLDLNQLNVKNINLNDLNSEIGLMGYAKDESFFSSNLETLLAQRSDLLFRQISDLSSIDLLCLFIELHKVEELLHILNPKISQVDHEGYEK
jgi:hypothetical protein